MFLSPAARKGALANLVEATGLLSDLARICLEYYFCKEKIYATARAFAATLYYGLVFTWGDEANGGDSSGVQSELKTGVDIIYSTERSFCAKLVNGGIVTWGHERWGGDSSGMQAELKTGVDIIYSNERSFCAKLVNGGIV